MHTSNYWDVYNAEKNEGSPEDTYILSTEDTDGHNEIIELD